ncbi:MAG: hypothetical protein K0S28_659 [Paucimonas sp.]|nr:hypothetical protein [Paucimonas sp.]
MMCMNANPNATMSTISTFIKHLKQLTAHRDHTLLDIAAVAALHELVGASQARVLKIARIGEYQFVQPQVWIRDSQVVSMEESLDSAERGEPLENYPTLVECIEQRLLKNEHTETDGHTVMWLPVWINDRLPEPAGLQRTRFADGPFQPQDLRRKIREDFCRI